MWSVYNNTDALELTATLQVNRVVFRLNFACMFIIESYTKYKENL